MGLRGILDKLAALPEQDGPVVTVTLDVSGSAVLPEATRVFLKDRILRSHLQGGRASERRAASESLIARLTSHVESKLGRELDGLYVAAGNGFWETAELRVALPNACYEGRAPYLAPLLEAMDGAPCCWVARGDERECRLDAFELGEWTEIDRWRPALIDRDAERLVSGRTPVRRSGSGRGRSGIGGAKRDRFEQSLEAGTARALESLARRLDRFHARNPASAVFWFGDPERFREFRRRLPAPLRDRAESLGPFPRREILLHEKVARALEQRVAEHRAAEVAEFRERWAKGRMVAVGPSDVLSHGDRGRLARVYIDAQDPVPGRKCSPCGSLYGADELLCGFCGGPTLPTSLTQEIVRRAWTHPPLPLTFVPHSGPWLKQLGGMAALLSEKGIRVRR